MKISLYQPNQFNKSNFHSKFNILLQSFVFPVFLSISFLILPNNNCYGQEANEFTLGNNLKVKIDSIVISGAKTTEKFVIINELNFSVGDSISQKILDYNEARIMSLRLFYSVNLKILKEKNKNILNIYVKEGWYIFPIPFVNIQSNKLSRSNYGISLNWRNFRGRNETIRAIFSLGYNPSFGLFYVNPLLIPYSDISLFAGISKVSVENKSRLAELLAGSDFDYKLFDVYAGLGFRLNIYDMLSFRLGYDYLTSPFAKKQVTASGNSYDKIPSFTITFQHDTRNLKQFPEKGLYTLAYITHKGFGLQNISYFITWVDFREYRELFIKNLTTKWRIAFRKVFGKNKPFYDDSYLGFKEFVRGHKNDEREGNNLLIGSLELSYPLVNEFNLSVKLPLLPQSLTSYLISVRLSVFGDTGVTFNNGNPVMINKFDSGYGFGVTFLFLPYNAIRFEYAFNEKGRGEFLFGTEFSF